MIKKLLCKIYGHRFGPWEYLSDDACEEERICKRDGFTETRLVMHRYGDWRYGSENSCNQVRFCKQHDYKETRQVAHKFGVWQYISDSSCEQVRFCNRCNFERRRQAPHQFLDINEEITESHKSGLWKEDPGNVCDETLNCYRCGFTYYRTVTLLLVENLSIEGFYWDEPWPNYGREDIQHQYVFDFKVKTSRKNQEKGIKIEELQFKGAQTRADYPTPDSMRDKYHDWIKGTVLVNTAEYVLRYDNVTKKVRTGSEMTDTIQNYQGINSWVLTVKNAVILGESLEPFFELSN